MQEQQRLLDGRYQVIRQLGEGAFARTYLVEDTLVQRPDRLVVKQFKQLANSTQAIKEFEALLKLFDPHDPDPACLHLPWIYEVHPVDHEAHIIMDYIRGPTLKEGASEFPWSVEDWWTVARSLLGVLELLEEHHLLHRDIKPENIILRNGDRRQPVLIDFGFATPRSVTTTGAGTPGYLPPELWASSRPPESSDRYALSIVLFQILTGREPIYELAKDGYTRIVCMPPSVDKKVRPLAKLLLTAIATDPAKRPRSASELRERLEEAMKGIPQKDKPPLPQLSPTRDELPSTPTSPVELIDSPKREPPANRAIRKPKSTQESRDRRWMLAKVRSFWIQGVLDESLHGAALITLGLREQRDAVANPSVISPWRLILHQQNQPPSSLPSGTHITQVFDKVNGELLILGEPGSGKTTLLLELTRDLLDRAQKNSKRPIPVVFNLSSWTVKRQPLIQWLIEELNVKYQIPRKVSQTWIDADHLLLLLDGLDEVAPDYREACIDAINEYRRNHGQVPMVVCCRSTEFEQTRLGLLLQSAVVVQPLTREQIEAYLISGGEKLAGVRQAFDEDKELQALITTPLMLSIITLAYSGIPAEQFSITGSLATRKQQVFATYVQRQLSTRQAGRHYTQEHSVHWLSWLAQQLVKQNQTEFYLERMQLDWLPKKLSYRLYPSIFMGLVYFLGVTLIYGLYFALFPIPPNLPSGFASGALMGLLTWCLYVLLNGVIFEVLGDRETQKQPEQRGISSLDSGGQRLITFLGNRLVYGLMFGLLNGALVGWLGVVNNVFFQKLPNGVQYGNGPSPIIYGLVNLVTVTLFFSVLGKLDIKIQPAEIVVWSWKSVRLNLGRFFVFGLLLGFIYTVIMGKLFMGTWAIQISIGIGIGVSLVLTFAVLSGLSHEMVSEKNIITPNQGIRRSFRNSIFIGSFTALMTVFPFAIQSLLTIVVPNGVLGSGPMQGLVLGLVCGIAVGLNFFARYGGTAFILHALLRVCLWRANDAPLNYPRFLDFAVEHILLRRVGGGYIFIHRLLQDYFAELYEETNSHQEAQQIQIKFQFS